MWDIQFYKTILRNKTSIREKSKGQKQDKMDRTETTEPKRGEDGEEEDDTDCIDVCDSFCDILLSIIFCCGIFDNCSGGSSGDCCGC